MNKMNANRVLAAGVLFCAFAVQAQVAGSSDEAKTRFKRGLELYEESNFRAALAEFERAYELTPSYKLLYNIGQVQMELHDDAGALRAYSRYLREGGPDVSAARREQVALELERLKARVGQLFIESEAGAEVLIDEMSVGFVPLPEPVSVNAGRHRVTVHISGREALSRVVDVAGQQVLTVALHSESRPASLAVEEAPRAPSKTPQYVALGATAALAIGAGVTAGLAVKASSDLKTLRGSYPVTRQQLDAQATKLSNLSTVADAITAAAVAAGGVALYWILTHRQEPSASTKISLVFGAGPSGVSLGGTF